ncbi:MAG: nucleotidyltransferase domain-containing protein [Candidatus Nanohalobium sp.]
MDKNTVEEVRERLMEKAEEENIELDELIVFGSRAREDYRESSDVDVLLVSPDFEDTNYYKRPRPFYDAWNYDKLPEPEFICLTPEEFREKREKKPNIVRTAVEEGVRLA